MISPMALLTKSSIKNSYYIQFMLAVQISRTFYLTLFILIFLNIILVSVAFYSKFQINDVVCNKCRNISNIDHWIYKRIPFYVARSAVNVMATYKKSKKVFETLI